MITEFLKDITIWFGDLGYWGVFLACLGLFPAEIVIAMVGAVKPNNLIGISMAAALGEMLGAVPTYLVGYYFRNKDILKFLNGKGKFLNVSDKSYRNGYNFINKTGAIYIFFSRFVPWVRVAASIIAGYVKYNLILSSIAIFFATFIYAYIFAYVGTKIGDTWHEIKIIIDTFNNSMLLLTGIGLCIYVYLNRKRFFGK